MKNVSHELKFGNLLISSVPTFKNVSEMFSIFFLYRICEVMETSYSTDYDKIAMFRSKFVFMK